MVSGDEQEDYDALLAASSPFAVKEARTTRTDV